jgi:serine-type D-Ala-D-Ala carboxypeptidase/endopeptidase (penicillin-binding protein 4)
MRWQITSFLFLMSMSLLGQHFSNRKIARMLKKIPAFEQSHVALAVEPLNTSKPKAYYQGEKYMTPASNVKLLTFLAAIQSFDSLPSLYYKEKDSIMHFKATGYPLLYHPFYPDPELAYFFDQKYSWHYHVPKSKLNTHGHGWSWDDYPYYYAAETSPFPIYGNTTQVFVAPNNNRMIPRPLEKQLVLDTLKQKIHRERSKNRFYLNPQMINERDTLYKPFITSDSLFIHLLEKHIEHPVKLVENSQIFSNWDVLYSNQEVLLYKALLQDSDNGIAEALLNMVSQKIIDKMNIQKIIDTLKIQWNRWLPDPIEWVDGSGVSRYNMITPRTLIAVLKKIHQETGFETIKKYFPRSASSGTLKDYAVRNVYAKTGTLRHNHSLSGYWISDRGNVYVFSIMANHFTATSDEIRKGISKLLRQFQKKLK